MKIKVTYLDTNTETVYDYSKDNWAKRWACMKGGLVHMWAPKEAGKGIVIKTSGRKWEVLG